MAEPCPVAAWPRLGVDQVPHRCLLRGARVRYKNDVIIEVFSAGIHRVSRGFFAIWQEGRAADQEENHHRRGRKTRRPGAGACATAGVCWQAGSCTDVRRRRSVARFLTLRSASADGEVHAARTAQTAGGPGAETRGSAAGTFTEAGSRSPGSAGTFREARSRSPVAAGVGLKVWYARCIAA